MWFPEPVDRNALVAGGVAAVFSGVPSTVHAVLTGRDPLEAAYAAGSIALPDTTRRWALLAAGVGVHTVLSLGWALVLAALLPRRGAAVAGGAAGLAIAALDLGILGRALPRIRDLPLLPQVADHVAYGALFGATLQRQRSDR